MKTDKQSRLVLRRRPGESFRMGNDIEIKIDSIEGKLATISIVAPRGLPIMRTELISNEFKD